MFRYFRFVSQSKRQLNEQRNEELVSNDVKYNPHETPTQTHPLTCRNCLHPPTPRRNDGRHTHGFKHRGRPPLLLLLQMGV